MDRIKRILCSITTWLLFAHVVICICSFLLIPGYYTKVLKGSDVAVETSLDSNVNISGFPTWFAIEKDSIRTSKSISDEDKNFLYTLVDKKDSIYSVYVNDIDILAYKSNTTTPDLWTLIVLTLCFVSLGCCARSFYDFIGHKCYLRNQDMEMWWSWYLFRPLIGVPIASFMLVASRSAMFSTLFTSRDLNTYIVVSFLAGFAMMEFLTMLRRASKGLFGGN